MLSSQRPGENAHRLRSLQTGPGQAANICLCWLVAGQSEFDRELANRGFTDQFWHALAGLQGEPVPQLRGIAALTERQRKQVFQASGRADPCQDLLGIAFQRKCPRGLRSQQKFGAHRLDIRSLLSGGGYCRKSRHTRKHSLSDCNNVLITSGAVT